MNEIVNLRRLTTQVLQTFTVRQVQVSGDVTTPTLVSSEQDTNVAQCPQNKQKHIIHTTVVGTKGAAHLAQTVF